jgi:hypothetical protein
MPVRNAIVLLSFASLFAASAALGADRAPWAGAADESGRPADPNAGSRGAPAPTRAAPVAAQPPAAERPPTAAAARQRTRSAVSGASAVDRSRGSAAAAPETAPSSRSATAASSASEDHVGWRERDWGWFGLLGLLGLFGLLGRRRREREYYTDEATAQEARDTRVYEPSPRATRP